MFVLLCSSVKKVNASTVSSSRSKGFLFRYFSKFSWEKEREMLCPGNDEVLWSLISR